ncbi:MULTISPECIES: hypothetical protein [Pseudomonas]|uniref:hypothetical protein n=1 Tax=Pseudomonas TaxID=286 RepID=UPI001E556047|nr:MULTISPECIES: hypothetical protein [Pseudomonas]MCE1114415.1 hypothetical protein [Pseudomonas sp. NMI795_08]
MNAKPIAFKPLLLLAVVAGLAGCQTAKPSPETLKQRAEITLGTPVNQVSKVRNDSNTTYFTASTAKGQYDCQVPSGGLVAVAGMGIYTPSPTCWKEGQAPVFQ